MFKKKLLSNNNGASLFQYIIILAIIGSVVAIGFTLIGNTLIESFKGFSDGFSTEETKTNTAIDTTSTTPAVTPGELGGAPNNPVVKCDGLCTIDFGDYVLTGIPEDFQSFVSTTGFSGGSDKIAEILNQMAVQLDNPDTPEDESKNIKDLANLGHILAEFQKHIEDKAKECSTTSYATACFHNFICDTSTFTPSDPSLLANFPGLNLTGTVGDQSVSNDRVGGAMHEYLLAPDVFAANTNVDLAFTIVDKYTKIQDDPNFTDAQKAVVKQMYAQIAIMAEKIDAKVWGVSGINEEIIINDPITGIGVAEDVTKYTNEYIFKPGTSVITDLDSAIICATVDKSNPDYNCQ